ncbi:hypothetical protein [Corynebacterium spheniscorum]|nr:hypothetical protein [Corynebacterium spheniscorum]
MCALSASCAEMTQVVAMVWVTFALTKNATLVGIVNAAIFLPGVVLGLYFHRHADKGDAGSLLKLTNRVLVVGALGLMLVWAFGEYPPHRRRINYRAVRFELRQITE